ncbi:MAG: S8 family serine peptidase [Hyphomicrobiaceae bacterium]
MKSISGGDIKRRGRPGAVLGRVTGVCVVGLVLFVGDMLSGLVSDAGDGLLFGAAQARGGRRSRDDDGHRSSRRNDDDDRQRASQPSRVETESRRDDSSRNEAPRIEPSFNHDSPSPVSEVPGSRAERDDQGESRSEDRSERRSNEWRHGRRDRGDDRREKELPYTIEELVQRWSVPALPASIPAATPPLAAVPKAAPASVPAKAAAGRAGYRGGIADISIDPEKMLGSRVSNEILAVGSGNELAKKAEALGLSVRRQSTLGGLGLSIMQFVARPGVNIDQARAMLEKSQGKPVGFNHIYRPYKPAISEKSEKDDVASRRGADGSCSSLRCYGPAVISWRPKLNRCAEGMRIGLLDTGIDRRHPALRGSEIQAARFARGRRPTVGSHHGTSTLAILAGTPDGVTPGLLPSASYFAADIFHADSNGEAVADSVALLTALDWMASNDVRVVNMSIAGPPDKLLQQTIDRLSKNGMIFVAAAGNDGPDGPPLYPAAYSKVIAVTAVARDLRSYRKANRGRHIDFAAPGVDIWTAIDGGGGWVSGTSFAVPFATAVIATTTGIERARGKAAVLAKLHFKDLGTRGPDEVYGRGLVLAPKSCARRPRKPAVTASIPRKPPDVRWDTTVSPTKIQGVGLQVMGGVSVGP